MIVQLPLGFLRALRALFRPRCPAPPRAEARLHVDRHVQPRMTESEVLRLLGPPDASEARQWIYYIDPRRGWRVTFDTSMTVASVKSWIR